MSEAAVPAKEQAWTPAQRDAIEATDEDILVSAAAGSGKTSVLAERCAGLVCHPTSPCAVTDLLVVTFTRAAAAEMRSRIEKRLRERCAADPADRRVARQLVLLDRAEIGTLHAFCGKVVRRHFAELQIDPAFAQLDEHEARLLKNEVAERLFDASFAGPDAAAAAAFGRFLDGYAGGSLPALRGMVLRTYELSRSTPAPAVWAQEMMGRLLEAAERPLAESRLGRELLAELVREVEGLFGRIGRLKRRADALFVGYSDAFDVLLGVLSECRANLTRGDLSACCHAFTAAAEGKERAPTFKNLDEATKQKKERAKDLLDAAKAALFGKSSIYRVARFDEPTWRDGVQQVIPAAEQLLSLVDAFEARYQEAKRGLRAMDFTDLERWTLEVLAEPGSVATGRPRPSAAARAYHEQFRHVLVDEYQDINALQDAILRLVSHECLTDDERANRGQPPNLFCVGDVKQSIYRFRLADPKLFLDRTAHFRAEQKRSPPPPRAGRVIDLSENFRSTPPILDAVNAVFERLMTVEAAELTYDESQRLRPGRATGDYQPVSGGRSVELYVLPKPDAGADGDAHPDEGGGDALDFDRTEREAAVVATLIRDAVGGPSTPAEDRFTFGQIAILLRAMAHKARQFASILRRFGIPVIADAGDGFFAATEVQDVLALLRVLDNPLQDIPLAALLRGPIAGLSGNADDKLAHVRLLNRSRPFHRAVYDYASAKGEAVDAALAAELANRLALLDRWRREMQRRPAAEVLWRVLDERGVLAWNAALRDGEQRVANLLHLYDLARTFGSFQKQGLKRFLAFLETLEVESDLGQAAVVRNPGNVVQIMSVHRSKGLQFPMVIVPDLGKQRNEQDLNGLMLVDRDAGVAPRVVDLARGVHYPSLAHHVARQRVARKLVAEELRVLYVAMTRAERRLILLGSAARGDQVQAWRDEWSGHRGPLPPEVLAGRGSMLDWVGPACVAGGEGLIRMIDVPPAEVEEATNAARKHIAGVQVPPEVQAMQPTGGAANDEAAKEAAGKAVEELAWRDPMEGWSQVPAARAVTQLAKSGRAAPGAKSLTERGVVAFHRPLNRPRFEQQPDDGRQRTSATEAGQATHRVLQSMRLRDVAHTAAGVSGEVAGLVAERKLSLAESESVDVEAVAWFLSTPLGQLMRSCNPPDGELPRLYRELPVFAPATAEQTALAVGANGMNPALPLPKSADPLDHTMLRGQLDVLIETTDGGLIVVDYKTDRVTAATLPARVEFYRPQVQAYSAAVAQLSGKPVVGVKLVFLAVREIVDILPAAPSAVRTQPTALL